MDYRIIISRDGEVIADTNFTSSKEASNFIQTIGRVPQNDPSLTGEVWKPIPGYDGYEASNLGRVRTLKQGGRLVLSQKEHKRYLTVKISENGVKRSKFVHRLVALAFLPNPNLLPEVNHKDYDHYNNKIENLEWCSSEYNLKHAQLRPRVVTELEHKHRSEASKIRWKNRLEKMPERYEFIEISTGRTYRFKSVNDAVRLLGGYQQGYWAVLRGMNKQHHGYQVKRL